MAQRMPSAENAYRNLILNQRVNMHNPFVSRSVWEANGGDVDEMAFEGSVYVGVDLSARNDLTAIVSVAPGEHGGWHVRPEFYAPEIGLADRAHRDREPYDVWVKQGHMQTTPGATVDYDFIADRLIEIAAQASTVKVVADRWRLKELEAALSRRDMEIPIEGFGQGFQSMAPALDALESELLNNRIRHGNHPVLRMCAANAVAVRNPAGDRKLDKSKATGRIDGLVALAMAMGAASVGTQEEAPKSYQMMFI
jgi:phage terminase large subunit-like protein